MVHNGSTITKISMMRHCHPHNMSYVATLCFCPIEMKTIIMNHEYISATVQNCS